MEGAFAIPLVFLLLLLLLQPGILLYDRMVMNAAAAEGCRMLATRSADAGVDAAAYEEGHSAARELPSPSRWLFVGYRACGR